MKLLPLLAGTLFAGLGAPALADTIVDTIGFSGNIAPDGQEVFGPSFDPSLGTLTSVSLFVSGQYTPDIFVQRPNAPSTTLSNFSAFYSTFGSSEAFGEGSYTLTQVGNFLTGPVEDFSFSTGALPFPTDYIGGPAFPTTFLANVAAGSRPTAAGDWGTYDDISKFSGTLQVTYTYSVDEPSSLALLAAGLGLLGFVVRTRRSA